MKKKMETSKKSIVNLDQVDLSFIFKIARIGAGNVLNCFQCGECVATCPVSLINSIYNPRKILKFIKLGLKKELLTNEFIWLCSLCHLCWERCPQNVSIPEAIIVLRNLAAKEGYIPLSFKKLVLILKEHGRVYEIDDLVNLERKELGLPPIYEASKDVKKIFDITGFYKKIEGIS